MEQIKLSSIDAYNKLYGLETLHPLVSVIDLKNATKSVNHILMDYGVYALFLKQGTRCTLSYGRREYDYQEGTVVSFSPGQIVGVDLDEDEFAPDVIGLMFHPDLIYGTPLVEKIREFGFFEYSQREALHLSAQERQLFLDCLAKVKHEVEHPVDHHSASLISANILLLLEYLDRFYDRQFITRHKVNSDIVADFEHNLKAYNFASNGQPSVAHFAEKANLSPGYFGDLIKKETGKTVQELISLHIVDRAKQRLNSTTDDIALIAYDLGFQYPQHFTRFFKKHTSKSPTAYRKEAIN